MQNDLFCWHITPGESKALSAGETGAATSGRHLASDRPDSFPATLQKMAEPADPQPGAGSDPPQAPAQRRIDSEANSQPAGGGQPDRPEPTVGVGTLMPAMDETGPIEAIVATGESLVAEPAAAAAADDDAVMDAKHLPPKRFDQAMAASAGRQVPTDASGSRAVDSADAGAQLLSEPSADRTSAGAKPAVDVAGAQMAKGVASTSVDAPTGPPTGPPTGHTEMREPARSGQAADTAAGPKNDSGRELAAAGEAVQAQPRPAARNARTGRDRTVAQQPRSAAGEPPFERTEAPAERQASAASKTTAASNGSGDGTSAAVERLASEQLETAPPKAPAELNSRSAPAAPPDGRLLQPAVDPQSLSGQPANAEKPNPADVVDQIVKKAVIRLGEGQSEARIDLKPELLGQLRLQIVTENQQVTLRILAETPLVKEIIENSAVQLKADLLSQGLQMEELEVGLSDDHARFGRRWDDTDPNPQGARQKNGSPLEDADNIAQAAAVAAPNVSGGGIDTFA